MTLENATEHRLPDSQLVRALSKAFAYPAEGIGKTIEDLRDYASSGDLKWAARAAEVAALANGFADITSEQLAYTRLFIGSLKMEAPPYASYYLGDEHLLNGEAAVEVEEIYAMFGMQLSDSEIAPADHLRYLLAFLSLLAERFEKTGEEAIAEAFDDFRDDYVLSWLDECIELVELYADNDYYPALVELISDMLKAGKNQEY